MPTVRQLSDREGVLIIAFNGNPSPDGIKTGIDRAFTGVDLFEVQVVGVAATEFLVHADADAENAVERK